MLLQYRSLRGTCCTAVWSRVLLLFLFKARASGRPKEAEKLVMEGEPPVDQSEIGEGRGASRDDDHDDSVPVMPSSIAPVLRRNENRIPRMHHAPASTTGDCVDTISPGASSVTSGGATRSLKAEQIQQVLKEPRSDAVGGDARPGALAMSNAARNLKGELEQAILSKQATEQRPKPTDVRQLKRAQLDLLVGQDDEGESSRKQHENPSLPADDEDDDLEDLSPVDVELERGCGASHTSVTELTNEDDPFETGSQQARIPIVATPGKDDTVAVATPVDANQEDPYTPKAEEYHPTAPSISRRFRFYAIAGVAFVAVVAAVVVLGAVLGKALSSSNGRAPEGLPYRETIGIRETVELVVDSDQLDDSSGPYHKALEWITHHDPMQPTPEQPNFLQRFFASYFYFATSVRHDWNWCNPARDNETDFCVFREQNGIRWLSNFTECRWVGIKCDEVGQVRMIRLRKFCFCIADELRRRTYLTHSVYSHHRWDESQWSFSGPFRFSLLAEF